MKVPAVHTSSKEVVQVSLGADVGGTSIKYGALALDGVTLPSFYGTENIHQIDSKVKEGLPATIEQIEKALEHEDLKGRVDLKALGLAVAGHASLDGVMVISSNYGPLWTGVPVKAEVEKYFNVPTSFNNDAAAMIAEFEALKHSEPELAMRDGILFTIGTGLGGGAVTNQQVYLGANGQSTEFGHLPVRGERSSVDVRSNGMQCGCGDVGCAEQFTSLSYIQRELVAKLQLSENQTHALNSFIPEIAAKKVLSFAADGDNLSRSIIYDQAYNVGRVLLVVKEAFDPAWAIIGGGITDTTALMKTLYLDGVKAGVGPKGAHINIRYAQTGENAGWLGAAKSALDLI